MAVMQVMPNTLILGERILHACKYGQCKLSAHFRLFYRLDDDYIVFRGSEEEAASAHLKGTVVLCLSEPLAIKHVKLNLTGMSRVWYGLISLSSVECLPLTLFKLVYPVHCVRRHTKALEGTGVLRKIMEVQGRRQRKDRNLAGRQLRVSL